MTTKRIGRVHFTRQSHQDSCRGLEVYELMINLLLTLCEIGVDPLGTGKIGAVNSCVSLHQSYWRFFLKIDLFVLCTLGHDIPCCISMVLCSHNALYDLECHFDV